jgi:hypothetical protein
MSLLDRVYAFRRIPPKRRFQARFRPRLCIWAEYGDIAAEVRCLQNACSRVADFGAIRPALATLAHRRQGGARSPPRRRRRASRHARMQPRRRRLRLPRGVLPAAAHDVEGWWPERDMRSLPHLLAAASSAVARSRSPSACVIRARTSRASSLANVIPFKRLRSSRRSITARAAATSPLGEPRHGQL